MYSVTNMITPTELTTPSFSSSSLINIGGTDVQDQMLRPDSDGFVGCIDRVVVNNVQLSLLLPKERTSDVATCEPR